MASRYEVEVTILSAKDLKNVNWRHGSNSPYAVVWVDPNRKCSTKVDDVGDTCPCWDETLVIPLPGPVEDGDTKLCIDIVHAGDEEDTKKLIGSAKLKLVDVLEEAGFGEAVKRSLTLKRPSGRPHGKVDVKVTIREPRYRQPDAYYAPNYGVPPPYAAPQQYGYHQYGQQPPPPPQNPYYSTIPTGGYEHGGQNAPPHSTAPYGEASVGYYEQHEKEKKKSSKFGGMGTGLAVGAVAGVLGGLAIAEGVDAVEDHIAEEAAEKVEEDLGYDEGNDGGDDDF